MDKYCIASTLQQLLHCAIVPVGVALYCTSQACSQDRFWGGVGPPKSGLFEPHPLKHPTKTLFWPTLWLKVDLLADLEIFAAHPRMS